MSRYSRLLPSAFLSSLVPRGEGSWTSWRSRARVRVQGNLFAWTRTAEFKDKRATRASDGGGVHPPGKTKKILNSRLGQRGVSSKRLAHNGTVRVTSFLTSCQVASLTASPLLCRRRQLDVARRWRSLLRATTTTTTARRGGGGDAGGVDVGRRRRLRRHKVPATASLLPAWRASHPTTARRRLIRWPELKRSQWICRAGLRPREKSNPEDIASSEALIPFLVSPAGGRKFADRERWENIPSSMRRI